MFHVEHSAPKPEQTGFRKRIALQGFQLDVQPLHQFIELVQIAVMNDDPSLFRSPSDLYPQAQLP
ncbi:MAG: hypothetical protein KatS3mg104_2567 [Phycisphaerae bacterium]|nr:MAG: hypothetical protein KatS3mg104_2567 [Phycisphaerae bacterium]